jgi:hypothetical protein
VTARARRWLWWIGGTVAGAVLVTVLVVAAAPWAVRWAATAWAESITGRPVTAGDVDVSLRDARVVFSEVAVAGAGPPLATIERVLVDLRWRPLLRGRVRIERLELSTPVVRIERTPDGATTVDDVVAHLQREPRTGAPLDIEIARAAIDDGRLVFTDREPTPTRVWEMREIDATFADVATRGEPRGTGLFTARLADGDLRVEADQLRLWPFHARAEGRATALDIAGVGAYVPAAAALRPVAGRLSSRTSALVDEGGVRLQGRSTLEQVELVRPGQREAFVSIPRMTLAADGLHIGGAGPTSADRVEVNGSARIHDTRASRGGPVVLSRIHGVMRDVRVADNTPAPVRIDVALPDNGALEARGTATFQPLSAELRVSVSEAPLAVLAGYIPQSSPVHARTGRVGADLRVRLAAESGVGVSGDVHTSGLALYRRDAQDPFLVSPRLDVAIHELRVQDGAMTVQRLTLSGHPTFIDRSVTPPVRWEVAEATGTVTDLSWPSGPPARVHATARLAAGGRSTLEGSIAPSPLEVSARLRVHDLPATRINGYLPDATAARVDRGMVAADIRLDHREDDPVRLAGTVTAANIAVRTGPDTPMITDPSVRLTAAATVAPDGDVILERATLDATPAIGDVAFRGLHIEAGHLRWPTRAATPLRAIARLPGSGSVDVSGTARLDDGTVAVTATVRDAALSPWAPLVGVEAPVAGRVDAGLTVSGSFRRPETLTTSGEAVARDIRVGDGAEPVIRAATVTARGFRLVGARRLHLDSLVAQAPSVVVTRTEHGRFPIVAMLGLREADGEDGRSPASADRADGDTGGRLAIDVDRIAIEDGYARFVDRSTAPPFTEELRRISALVTRLDNTDAEPAGVELDAVVGEGGALHLAGSVAPFAEPFVLDVAGTLDDFRVPATNPYLRQTFGWIARRGRLTTQVHYRVEGNRLEATNEVLVENLTVRRATDEVDPRIGMPLGLIVAVLKNARGDIEVTVPVTGNLGRPEFRFGDALARAAQQLVGKLVTGPFRAIGRVLRGDDSGDIADLAVDPIRFPEGSARLTTDAREHVGHIADFLRETPGVDVTLRPVVARDDLQALRREAAVARVQRYQREQGIGDFAAAARALAGAAPDAPPDTVLDTLAAGETLPIDAAQQLAGARAATAREALAGVAGDTLARVQTGAATIERNNPEGGRVEIELSPRTTGEDDRP